MWNDERKIYSRLGYKWEGVNPNTKKKEKSERSKWAYNIFKTVLIFGTECKKNLILLLDPFLNDK